MALFPLGLTRTLIGLAQGIALYLLYRAAHEVKGWPATEPMTYAALAAVALFIPILVAAGLRNLRPRTLAAWGLVAAVVCAGLAVY
ncbi:MAG TPA: DUF4153 domain-containing protein, partial [Hyphomicrobiaceae bacterium]|nr:DUF4153 domain-containing protein [Hyphomicrobiaceae bacterium]